LKQRSELIRPSAARPEAEEKAVAKIGQMVALANQKHKVPGICARIRIKFCDIQCNSSADHCSSDMIALAAREADGGSFCLSLKSCGMPANVSKRGGETRPMCFQEFMSHGFP
jgi:hypothetical protein